MSPALQSRPDAGTLTEGKPLGAKVYLNGFPKSGLHMALLMATNLALPWTGVEVYGHKPDPHQRTSHWGRTTPWCGTFTDHAFSTNWLPVERVIERVRTQPAGTWMKGHVGYDPDIERALWEAGTAFAFVYRDLRDVAVSATYHIENSADPRWKFPDRELYMGLPSHEDRLLAVIEGLGPYPGLFDRWELYAPWLECDWVFPIRFEWAREDPQWMAELFEEYVIKRTAGHLGFNIEPDQEHIRQSARSRVELIEARKYSPTFRKGETGGWRSEFTPHIKDVFKELAGDWLVNLGYEKDNDW